jgi:hypothetical protein
MQRLYLIYLLPLNPKRQHQLQSECSVNTRWPNTDINIDGKENAACLFTEITNPVSLALVIIVSTLSMRPVPCVIYTLDRTTT